MVIRHPIDIRRWDDIYKKAAEMRQRST